MPLKKPALIAIGAVLLFFGVVFCPSGQAGSYWRKVNINHPGQIEGVAMSPSGQHVVFSGDFTAHSSDRGVTWDTVNGCAFIMDFGDENHLFAVGTSQQGDVGVCRSTDYGQTWELNLLPMNLINFNEVDFIDSVHGWAVGNKGFIVTTNDGWQTWTTKPYRVAGFGGGGVVGTDTAVLTTTDGGNSWGPHSLSFPVFGATRIDFVDTLYGWLIGGQSQRDEVHHSTDGGNSWVEQGPLNGLLDRVEAVDSLHCWVLSGASTGEIWKTSNGGQNWVLEHSEPSGFLLDFDMADTAHGVAVGVNGLVLIYGLLIMGDLNGDEEIDLKDVTLEINRAFLGAPLEVPETAGDVNCDGVFTASDVVRVINRAFLGVPFPCSL